MVEQMLDLDRVARGKGNGGQQIADAVGQVEAALGGELVEQRRRPSLC